ncbi:hypothetical protein RB195_016072 [Necator americanus]|uniref:Uncharacterized protein n=1 Tax=Necator americanus TaxID=51031 RepID=A0ABR1E823_NECAM
MWTSSKPRAGIKVDGQPIEPIDEFCYMSCVLEEYCSYKKDTLQRCTKAIYALISFVDQISNEVKLLVYLSTVRLIMMYGSETWAAPTTNCGDEQEFVDFKLEEAMWAKMEISDKGGERGPEDIRCG